MFNLYPDDNTEAVVTKVYQALKAQSLAKAFNETLSFPYPIKVTTISLVFYLNNGTPSALAKNIDIMLTGGIGAKNPPVYIEANHSENNLVMYNNISIPVGMGVNVACSAVAGLNVECLIIYEKLKVQQD